MTYNELVEIAGTDVFSVLAKSMPIFSENVGKVFNSKYGDREILPIYSTLDSNAVILVKADELELIYSKKWQTLYNELITKDFEMGTITKNQTNSTGKVSDNNSTNRLEKVSGYDSEALVTDTGSDETKTGDKTNTSNISYTGNTSKQAEREAALAGLQTKTFYDIIFTDVIVSFCGYIA